MRSTHVQQLLGLIAVAVAACSHGQAARPAAPEPPAPTTATPHSELTAEEIQRTSGRPVEQLLMDRFPGVTVTRAVGGGISVRIRGASSFMSSSEPLYVLDGVPLAPGVGLRSLNPYDIVSIEVVKDPAGTALYGVRGGNGVIIIKTKVH